jgi:signal transduction histidine kinase
MSLVEELRTIKIFEDLPEDQLAWLAERGSEIRLAPGETVARAGDAADRMFVVLQGELQFRRDGAYMSTARAGSVSGLLPFSRMTHFTVTLEAVTPARVAWFSSSIFPEMCQRMPPLIGRLVALLTDRVREVTRMDEQREKLASLGKLSAGLAHELNNPAAAARRAAAGLADLLATARENNLRLNTYPLTPQQREYIARFECDTGQRASQAPLSLAPLEQSDREEQLGAWLEAHQVQDAWKLAPVLVECGVDSRELDSLVAQTGTELLSLVLGRTVILLTAAGLVREIEHSTARISDLVKAIKEYSYMDQAPEQEVDIHSGLDNTLTMMGHKIKKAGVAVRRDYDRSLPRVCAAGSELNQIWTNLIDNALDAMNSNGAGGVRQLTVHTARDPMGVLVEIADTGPGIPKEIQSRIFDPFYTTKPVGEGTGLGLDAVSRIVRRHRGDIRLDSQPGDTRFQVRLPLGRAPQ